MPPGGCYIDALKEHFIIHENGMPMLPSLVEHFGVQLNGIPWIEALNLCTVGILDTLLISTA